MIAAGAAPSPFGASAAGATLRVADPAGLSFAAVPSPSPGLDPVAEVNPWPTASAMSVFPVASTSSAPGSMGCSPSEISAPSELSERISPVSASITTSRPSVSMLISRRKSFHVAGFSLWTRSRTLPSILQFRSVTRLHFDVPVQPFVELMSITAP